MEESSKGLLFAVRLRGTAADNPDVRKTMESLRLERTFQARLLENTPSNLGMLRSAKALVAWGEVDPEILGRLLVKRG
ncbi:50S ribosomal protein L30, partial [Candidatus Bathyarchaeota archaeon]